MSKKRTRASKKLSISELKAYIEGAVELNPDDWAPSPEQWSNIVEMIMNVKENVIVQTVSTSASDADFGRGYAQEDRAETRVAAPQVAPSHITMDASQDNQRTRPMPPSIDASQNPTTRPRMERVGSQMSHDPTTGTISSGLKFRTPTIDTSDKPYSSGYE